MPVSLNKNNKTLDIETPTILALDGALAKSGICVIKNKEVFTAQYSNKDKRLDRLDSIYTDCVSLIEQYKPDLVAIEGYAFAAIGKVFHIAEGGACFRLAIKHAHKEIPTVEIPPTVLKKYITGSGKANKKDIANKIKQIFEIDFKTHDEADAFALAVCGLDYFTSPLPNLESFRDYLHKSCELIHGEHPKKLFLGTMANLDKETLQRIINE
jgi:crossover junction endodeoxyribonuclease RuvC